ncbi:hypothetical protein F4821DRAFT_141207 [Hypoxylon rubiginosum]|uniref:Uncharacterized protein n=1 Tax=Hypoxylon rubiginosum TaxID=110542 RepID=A0ACC0CZU4_9PEZI|nr:hypothetical protein F4821DRAFT_141207 [Hypoxylon rubiginosum]
MVKLNKAKKPERAQRMAKAMSSLTGGEGYELDPWQYWSLGRQPSTYPSSLSLTRSSSRTTPAEEAEESAGEMMEVARGRWYRLFLCCRGGRRISWEDDGGGKRKMAQAFLK